MILALDSSSSHSAVALVDGDRVVAEISVDTPRSRGGAIFLALQQILAANPPLARVVVGTGPGSYNGIRTALAAAWGIARAKSIPLVGISSLLGLDTGDYCAAGDARRGQYYYARIAAGRFAEPPELVSAAELLAKTSGRLTFIPSPLAILPEAQERTATAALLARWGANAAPASHIPEPLYLKAAHITQPRRSHDTPTG